MKTGDQVEVTNLDGDTAQGEIVAILAHTTEDYMVDFAGGDGTTLLDVWRGRDVDPDAPVVQVDLGTGVYEYPADKVEVTDE